MGSGENEIRIIRLSFSPEGVTRKQKKNREKAISWLDYCEANRHPKGLENTEVPKFEIRITKSPR